MAVPLSEEQIRDGMKKMVKERLGADFPVWSSEDLFPFVYSLSCEKFSEHDIISTSEQEICVRSTAFLVRIMIIEIIIITRSSLNIRILNTAFSI